MIRLSCALNSKCLEEWGNHLELDNVLPGLICNSFVLHQVQRYCLRIKITLDFLLVFKPISLGGELLKLQLFILEVSLIMLR